MKVSELLKKYSFHDSLVEKITLDASSSLVDFQIDFCFWMQPDYENAISETGIIHLRFAGVSNYSGISGELDSFSILSINEAAGIVTINLLDDFNDKYFDISFSSTEVFFEQ